MANNLIAFSKLSKEAQLKAVHDCNSLDCLGQILVHVINDSYKTFLERTGVFALPIVYASGSIHIVSFSIVRIPEGYRQKFFDYCGFRPNDWKSMLSGADPDFIIVKQPDILGEEWEGYSVLLFRNSVTPFKFIENQKLTKGLYKVLSDLYRSCIQIMHKIEKGDAETLDKCGAIFFEDGMLSYSALMDTNS